MSMISQSYANRESYEFYVKYLALKQHFTTDSYDYHKYHGKIRASIDTFRTRSDTYFFHKLSQHNDPINLMMSNMLQKPNIWIREIVEDRGEEVYIEWQRKIDSLSRTFKSDLNQLDDNYEANFTAVQGQHPLIMKLYMQKQITLETFTILTNISNIFPYWKKEIVDKIVSRDIIRLSIKYKPFLNIDEKKFGNIVRERFF
jgi:hypothetical protein